MATITKPMALDETFNTTETTPRNQADVLVGIEQAIVRGFGQVANAVSYDNTDSGLTADNVQDAIDEVDDTVDGLVDDVDGISSDIKSTQTATGNPITITDAAGINAEALKVEFSPKQDLHGYDFPWVGGAGKNKLPMTVDRIKAINTTGTWSGNVYTIYNVTITIMTDDGGNVTGFKVNGTSNGQFGFFLEDNLTLSAECKLNGAGDGSQSTYLVEATDGSHYYGSGSEDAVVPAGSGYAVYIAIRSGVTFNNKMFYPMLRLSTETDPTFAPWENICHIEGYYQSEVYARGINQWDEEWELGDYDNSGQAISGNYCIRSKQDDYIPVLGNTVYYVKCSETIYPCFYDIDKTFISKTQVIAYTTFTTPANARYMRFVIHGSYGTTYNHDISINYPSTNHDYHAYYSTSATIQFGQTVYGGRSNFTDGGTDDDRVKIDLGSLTWNKQWTDGGVKWRFYSSETISNIVVPVTADETVGAISSAFREVTLNQSWYGVDGICVNVDGSIFVCCNGVNNVTDFANLVTNETCVLYRTTPTQLSTPPTDLKLLKGTNNITTNGTTINLGYQPDNVIGDVKGEIEKCAVDAEFMQFTDGTDTFTDVNLSLDASFHTVSVVGSKIEQKRFICFEVAEIRSGSVQGIHASCIAFTDGAKTPSGTAFRAYIESLQMYVNFRIYGSGGSYTLAYQSETSFSASAFFVRLRMMNNL